MFVSFIKNAKKKLNLKEMQNINNIKIINTIQTTFFI